jgi:acetyl esterase/lipase
MKKCVTIFAFIVLIFQISLKAQHRYTDSLFTAVQTDQDRIYATAPELTNPYVGESSTTNINLKMDIYQPKGDTLTKRPVLIVAHGGAFISGTKENDDMVAFCKLFAEKGYVTATIQYRLGMNPVSEISGERAVYRGVQDGRAAIRYIKSIAKELKIDTDYVYFLGSSAGAFMALHNSFMNHNSERPAGTYKISHFPPTPDDGPDLGNLDAIASNLHYGAQANAIISLWGALADTTLIQSSDSTFPVLLVHGTNDQVVPFKVGSPFNLSSLSPVYGSYPISKRLAHLDFQYETYFVKGAGHEFYGVLNGMWNPAPNKYWDTVVTKTTNFLFKQHKPKAVFSYTRDVDIVNFSNESVGADRWLWNFGDSSTSTKMNPTHQYKSGTFTVSLEVYNQIDSWDTTSTTIIVIIDGVDDNTNHPNKFNLSQNYPNPFNPTTIISYQIPGTGFVTLKVYDVLGREIKTLVDGIKKRGKYKVQFNESSLPSGVYIYRLKVNNYTASKKMIILR